MFLSSEHNKGASNRLLDRHHGPSENRTARLMNSLHLLLDDKKKKKEKKHLSLHDAACVCLTTSLQLELLAHSGNTRAILAAEACRHALRSSVLMEDTRTAVAGARWSSLRVRHGCRKPRQLQKLPRHEARFALPSRLRTVPAFELPPGKSPRYA